MRLVGSRESDGGEPGVKTGAGRRETLTHARQKKQLGVLEAKGHDTHVQRRWLAHLSAQAEVLSADQATYQSTLHQALKLCIPSPWPRARRRVRPRSRANCTKPWRPSTPSVASIQRATIQRRSPNSSAKFPGSPPWSMPGSSGSNTRSPRWRSTNRLKGGYSSSCCPSSIGNTQVEKTKTPALKAAYQQAFRQAQAAPCSTPSPRR